MPQGRHLKLGFGLGAERWVAQRRSIPYWPAAAPAPDLSPSSCHRAAASSPANLQPQQNSAPMPDAAECPWLPASLLGSHTASAPSCHNKLAAVLRARGPKRCKCLLLGLPPTTAQCRPYQGEHFSDLAHRSHLPAPPCTGTKQGGCPLAHSTVVPAGGVHSPPVVLLQACLGHPRLRRCRGFTKSSKIL